ncbi:MAG TPA: hypothetical protein G4O17_02325 [Dehalococcoidia bacterium]|jgi:hypothetical protein|nr:hypothetical protein [Dehalococcoidia bacterium]
MKTKRIFLAVSITALIVAIILISLRAYYVTIALVAGTLIIGYREFWSLIRRKKLPPIDERVRENTGKAIRNGFIFSAIASAFLMLFFSVNLTVTPDIVHVLGGLFLSVGAVYLLSYLFYDRVEPKLDKRGLKMLKIFLLVAGISLGAFIISAVLHNSMSALFGIEEPVFFFIAVIIAPLAFAVGLIGSLVVFITGLFSRVS